MEEFEEEVFQRQQDHQKNRNMKSIIKIKINEEEEEVNEGAEAACHLYDFSSSAEESDLGSIIPENDTVISSLSGTFAMATTASQSQQQQQQHYASPSSKQPQQPPPLPTTTSSSFGNLQQQRKQRHSSSSMHELKLSHLGLYGRDREQALLRQCLENVKEGRVARHLVLISGYSGTGKTSLALALKKNNNKSKNNNDNLLLVRGKFDYKLRNEPYAGVGPACAEICGHVLSLKIHQPELFDTICTTLKQELGSQQLALLIQFLPVLGEVLEEDEYNNNNNAVAAASGAAQEQQESTSSSSSSGKQKTAGGSAEEAKNRFQFAFQRFIRVICQQFAPLVMVLDDLQWTDGSSLDLVEALIGDPGNSQLLLIGIYRSNEVHPTHLFYRMLEQLRAKHAALQKNSNGDHDDDPTNAFGLTELTIGNLDITAVQCILETVLSIPNNHKHHSNYTNNDKQSLEDLAHVCLKKTDGNAFFLLQFLLFLYEIQLIQFDYVRMQWIWDCAEIDVSASASSNVVDILKAKIKDLPPRWVELLKLAACLGSTFETRILKVLWNHQYNNNNSLGEIGAAAQLSPPQRMDPSRTITESTMMMNINHDNSGALMMQGLKFLEYSGYIKSCRCSHSKNDPTFYYNWTHDNIQEAVTELIPKEDRPDWNGHMGHVLLWHLSSEELDSAIFVVANLLNDAAASVAQSKHNNSKEHRLRVAQLNYQASRKALSVSAFESVAEYAARGIALMEQLNESGGWRDQYKLCLGLYSIGAQAEGYLGNVETMERYVKQVLAQEHRPMFDKFWVYNTWIDSMSNRGKLGEAVHILLGILKRFDCRFPTNPAVIGLGVAGHLVRMVAKLKMKKTTNNIMISNNSSSRNEDSKGSSLDDDNNSNGSSNGSSNGEDFLNLIEMTDPTRLELMKLLDKLTTCLYMEKDPRMPLVIFRSLNWTMKYGYCEYSSVAYATAGMMLTGIVNDIHGGSQYGAQALSMMHKSRSFLTHARTIFLVHSQLFPWTTPLGQLLKPLLHGYNVGLQSGDPESGMWSIYHWLILKYIMGSPLDVLQEDFRLYAKQMNDFKRQQHLLSTNYIRQVLLNLIGHNTNCNQLELIGEACSREDLELCKKNSFLLIGISAWQGILLTFFGEHVRHAEMALRDGHDYIQKGHLCSPVIPFDTMLKGVSCFVAAARTGERKYSKMAEKLRSKMRKWVALGNPNVKHYESLLDAESAALKNNPKEAIKNYESAVLKAARDGFLQDAAFASERLAEYQLRFMCDRAEATYRIDQAISYWRQWGAKAKVYDLEQKYSHVLLLSLSSSLALRQQQQPKEVYAISGSLNEEEEEEDDDDLAEDSFGYRS